MLQLASDESARYPYGATAVREHTYVDDILYGGHSLECALCNREQLIALLHSGGFALAKWAANHDELCPASPVTQRLLTESPDVSVLGLLWSAHTDEFRLRAVSPCTTTGCTKRTVLSDVARFFDPLGWATPVLIYSRTFLQELWAAKLSWDDPLPEGLRARWVAFACDLVGLSAITVPRYVGYSPENCRVSLHGFSDASEKAFGAVIYLRCETTTDVFTHLLVAKSKVAPLSAESIPRLELCGALLLARLMKATSDGLHMEDVPWHMWSDARVVLCWLSAHPSRWVPYVAHRVAAVQEIAPIERWRHVPTDSNPADLCTRGIGSDELLNSTLWWYGAPWLRLPPNAWPDSERDVSEDVQRVLDSTVRRTCVATVVKPTIGLLARYSSLSRLCRVVALCMRFVNNASNRKPKRIGFLTSLELRLARRRCIKLAQTQDYASDIDSLTRGERISSRSPLLSLRPSLTADGLLQVGGRLSLAPIGTEQRHPLILHKDNPLSELLLRDAHASTLHGGPQLMRSVITDIWIVRASILARRVYRACVRCARFRATPANQLMGALPEERVTKSRPFKRAGVDFAGPFLLTARRARGSVAYKAYLALFVCLSSKAIHLEIVSDLTTSAFVAAFKRFVSRRGACTALYSDNATNFHGADRELRSMFRAAAVDYRDAAALIANLGTEWHFIPPSAPHFGGLWEAGVKAAKYHIRRVIGDQVLTQEEMSTLIAQIEACLNSRPLCPLSNDVSDFSALTPGHLLIGEPLVGVPEANYDDCTAGTPLSRWQHLSRLRDHFWHRWSREYLQRLQPRHRWRHVKDNITIGTMVVIRDELAPPARWLLARVIETHPGQDGLVRVVTLRTASGTLQRPIHKLCPLPVYHRDPT